MHLANEYITLYSLEDFFGLFSAFYPILVTREVCYSAVRFTFPSLNVIFEVQLPLPKALLVEVCIIILCRPDATKGVVKFF
jgi:hypothetical protein